MPLHFPSVSLSHRGQTGCCFLLNCTCRTQTHIGQPQQGLNVLCFLLFSGLINSPESFPPAPRYTHQKRNLRDFSLVQEIRGPCGPDQTSLLESLSAQCASSIQRQFEPAGPHTAHCLGQAGTGFHCQDGKGSCSLIPWSSSPVAGKGKQCFALGAHGVEHDCALRTALTCKTACPSRRAGFLPCALWWVVSGPLPGLLGDLHISSPFLFLLGHLG